MSRVSQDFREDRQNYLNVSGCLMPQNPLLAVWMWINEQRHAICFHGNDAILNKEVIWRQTFEIPFGNLNKRQWNQFNPLNTFASLNKESMRLGRSLLHRTRWQLYVKLTLGSSSSHLLDLSMDGDRKAPRILRADSLIKQLRLTCFSIDMSSDLVYDVCWH